MDDAVRVEMDPMMRNQVWEPVDLPS